MQIKELYDIMQPKDWLSIVIIPLLLGLFAASWPAIQNWHRRRIFTKLILRELREIAPYPEEAKLEGCKKWQDHCQKTFIHKKIFEKPNENREFILSLDPDLVYYISQLWGSYKHGNWQQWDYSLEELSTKYDPISTTSKIFPGIKFISNFINKKRICYCIYCNLYPKEKNIICINCQREICMIRQKWRIIFDGYGYL